MKPAGADKLGQRHSERVPLIERDRVDICPVELAGLSAHL
jgi:hypothetical protein